MSDAVRVLKELREWIDQPGTFLAGHPARAKMATKIDDMIAREQAPAARAVPAFDRKTVKGGDE